MSAQHGGSTAQDTRKQLTRRAVPDVQIAQRNRPQNSRFLFISEDGEEKRHRGMSHKRSTRVDSELRRHVMLVAIDERRRQQMLQATASRTVSWGFTTQRIDPFDVLPIRGTPTIDAVIKFCT